MEHTNLDPCFRLHETLPQLMAAHRNGCPICKQIFARIRGAFPAQFSPTLATWTICQPSEETLKILFVNGRGVAVTRIDFRVLSFGYEEGVDYPSRINHLKVVESNITAKMANKPFDDTNPDALPEAFLGVRQEEWLLDQSPDVVLPQLAYPFSTRTDDDLVIKLAQCWLDSCVSGHTEKCSKDLGYIPPRLLDLRGSSIKLAVRHELEPLKLSYAALSHCWGKTSQPLVLTTQNKDSLCDGILMEILPQTFRDAILLCRKLSIQFLWIDSLCIIQSGELHEEDWQSHVSKMSSIYSRCILCIAADAAEDGTGGLFVTRDTTLFRPLFVNNVMHSHDSMAPPYKPPLSSSDSISRNKAGLIILNTSQTNLDLSTCHLPTRAWAYQERFLSPRVLHFGQDQIYWECISCDFASECFPRGGHAAHLNSLGSHLGPFAFDSSLNPNDQWGRIVDHYSERNLSYHKDKIPAIAGLAKQFSDAYHCTNYVAGFFESQLPVGLLWKRKRLPFSIVAEEKETRPMELYTAPTFSWASTTIPVEFPDFQPTGLNEFQILAEVKDIECKLIDQRNMFGEILSATMLITAPLYELSLTPAEIQTDVRQLDAEQTFVCFLDSTITRGYPSKYYDYLPVLVWNQSYNRSLSERCFIERSQDLLDSEYKPNESQYIEIVFDDKQQDLQVQYYVLWIRRRQRVEMYYTTVWHEGVILKRCQDNSGTDTEDTFTRTGYIEHAWSLEFDDQSPWIIEREFRGAGNWGPIDISDFQPPQESRETIRIL